MGHDRACPVSLPGTAGLGAAWPCVTLTQAQWRTQHHSKGHGATHETWPVLIKFRINRQFPSLYNGLTYLLSIVEEFLATGFLILERVEARSFGGPAQKNHHVKIEGTFVPERQGSCGRQRSLGMGTCSRVLWDRMSMEPTEAFLISPFAE